MAIENLLENLQKDRLEIARGFRKRIAEYSNPVEFVNNMYGSHPGDNGKDYFQEIYK